jgi:hypothetical protein
MSQIFICYSRKSQDVVEALAKDFEELEHNVWFDKELTGGQEWWEQILERINKCDIFVFALTPEALDSKACKLERKYASDLRKTILLIMVADGVSIKLLPSDLSAIQYVDYRRQDKQSFISLIKAIKTLPAPQPIPDPLPELPELPTSYLGNIKDKIEAKESTIEILKRTAVFRSEPTKLSRIEIQAMLVDKDLYDYRFNPKGNGFKNDYEILENGKVVLDHASGLMWQQSGSDTQISYGKVQPYIEVLNRQQFAGYTDWRLPTLEDSMSLMEPKKNKDGLYIDTVFDKKQRWIWTSDKPSDLILSSLPSAWIVYFGLGSCCDIDVEDVNIYVRAVR